MTTIHRLLAVPMLALLLVSCGDDGSTSLAADPSDGTSTPAASQTISGRVVGADRDGPSVEIVEVELVSGAEATAAARAAGDIGPGEEWELDVYVVEGGRRWVDLDPGLSVAVYDCTSGCEQVAGTLEHVLTGPPYGGAGAIWELELLAGRAVGAAEVYLP